MFKEKTLLITGGTGSFGNIVHTFHRLINTVVISDVTDVKFQFAIVQSHAHFFLLFFIAAEYANLAYIGRQEAIKHSVAERTRTAGNHQNFIFEHAERPGYWYKFINFIRLRQSGAT